MQVINKMKNEDDLISDGGKEKDRKCEGSLRS
jgi:hypothetical protein